MGLRLRHKITLLVTSVVVGSVLVSLVSLTFWIRREVRDRLDQELTTGGRVVVASIGYLAERLEIVCDSIAAAPRFKAAIDIGDPATVEDSGRAELARIDYPAMLVLDAGGAVLARIGPADFGAAIAASASLAAAALTGQGGSDLWPVDDRLYQVAARPIRFGDEISGAVVIGSPIDREVAGRLGHLTAAEVTILGRGGPVTSTLDRDGLAAQLAALEVPALESLPEGPSPPASVGRRHRALLIPLEDRTGARLAAVILQRSMDRELAYLRRVQWSLALGAALLAGVGFFLSVLFARAITNPLQVLVRSAQQVNAGNYDEPVEVTCADEIGLLAARFDEMRSSLKSKIQELIEQERLRSEMELEKHRSLSRMVAGVAHEINTPLGIVNQAASIIGESLATLDPTAMSASDEARETLGDVADAARLIQGNIAKANHLIQTFKNLSVRQVTDQRETVDLPELVAEIVELFGIQARLAGLAIRIENRLPVEERSWTGYPGFFSQVLMNLLTNVERYAYPPGEGGDLEIRLEPEGAGPDSGFLITVRDFGRGIPAENLSRIFDVFFTTGRGRGGTGLGLAIVHNLVTVALSGRIEVRSEAGSGATFAVSLPRVVPEPADDSMEVS